MQSIHKIKQGAFLHPIEHQDLDLKNALLKPFSQT